MNKLHDVDYLYASTRVRALEKNMLTSRDLEKMLDAATLDESYKTANDISLHSRLPVSEFESAIGEMLREEYKLVYSLTEQTGVFDIFRYKYDGHNLKVIIKAQAAGSDPLPIMSPLGLVSPEALVTRFHAGKIEGLPLLMCEAAFEASETLAKSHDPQAVDIAIDRAVLTSMKDSAQEIDFPFLTKVVDSLIDVENIRTAVRLKRMGRDAAFLKKLTVPGGALPLSRLYEAFGAEGFEAMKEVLFTTDYYRHFAPLFDALSPRKPLTKFERGAENYIIELLRSSRLVAFGLEPVICYLLAKENEAKLIRIVLASKAAGVARDKISERLREPYA